MSTDDKAKAMIYPRGEKIMRALMLETTGRVMKRTPVDTGRARANWNTSVQKPDYATNPDATSGDVPGKQRQHRQTTNGVQFMRGQVGYLANGLPYIGRLETGWSKQAPKGMVKLTVREMKDFIRREARAGRLKL